MGGLWSYVIALIDLYILYFLEKCQNISPPHLCEKCLSPESKQIVGDFFVPGGETRGGQSDLKRAYTRNAGPYRTLTFVVPALSLLALVERMFTSLSSSSSYCCIFALMYFCIIELSHCCMVVRLCCCIVVSLYCCKVVSLYHCSVALLYQSIVVYLYCCIVVLLTSDKFLCLLAVSAGLHGLLHLEHHAVPDEHTDSLKNIQNFLKSH